MSLGLLALVGFWACTGPDAEQPLPTNVGPYTKADFGQLRWIEGRWRGLGPSEHHFYEEYRVVGDTLVIMKSSSDSTFADSTSGGNVFFDNGDIVHESGDAAWHATGFDSTALHFEPRRRALNSFTWRYESPNSWTASIEAPGGRQTYRMERIPQ